MSPRREIRVLTLALVLAAAGAAAAGETIETNSFALTLPDGWKADLASKPVSAKGPRGEMLLISSNALKGTGPADEAARVRRETEEAALTAIRRAGADPALVVVKPLAKSTLPSGATLHETTSKAKDGSALFAQFVVTGPRAVVLVTLDAPAAAASSIDAVRAALTSIRWAR